MAESSGRKIKWGILSCANSARISWIPAIRETEPGEVSAIASRHLEKAKSWAAELGIEKAYGSYEELIDDENVEAVYIGLPNSLDCEWVIKCLDAGKNVLCDKPLGISAAEAEKMVEAAVKNKRLLMEGFMYHYDRQYEVMRQWVNEGKIGDLKLLRVALGSCYCPENNIRKDPKLGGGILFDGGSYGMHILRHMSGLEPLQAQGLSVLNKQGADWAMSGLLEFAGGIIGSFDCTFACELGQSLELVGTKGSIHSAFPLSFGQKNKLTIRYESSSHRELIEPSNNYSLLINDFQDRVLEKRWEPVPARDSILNMKVLDAIRKSAETGKKIKI